MVLKLPLIRKPVNDPDDSSVSSTLTVENFTKAKELHLSDSIINDGTKTTKKVKSVSFDLKKNVFHSVELNSAEDCKEVWYSANDYKDFKAIAKDAANQIIRIESRNRAPFSYQRVMENTFQACLNAKKENDQVLPESDFIHLMRWTEVATSRWGLEKWSMTKYSQDRSSRRRELSSTVLRIQQQQQQEEFRSDLRCDNKKSYSESIRVSSENVSRPSRLYAHIMALALESAEQSENQ